MSLPTLKNQSFYHQRFDGAPFFLNFIAVAELTPEKRKFTGGDGTSRICFFKNGRADWYIPQKDLEKTAAMLIKKLARTPQLGKKLMAKWKKDQTAFLKACEKIETLDLKKLSNPKLLTAFQDLTQKYLKRCTSSSLIDSFALTTDVKISQMIEKELTRLGQGKKFAEVFSRLTAPTYQHFVNEAEIALLELLLKIQKNPAAKKLFAQQPKKILKALKEQFPHLHRLINFYCQKYFYLRNNYIRDYQLTEKDVLAESQSILSSHTLLKRRLQEMENMPRENQRQKQALIRELKISKPLRKLLELSDDFTYWQDERKKSSFLATHYFSLIFKELAKRTSFSVKEFKFMFPAEICRVIKSASKPPAPHFKDKIQARLKECAVVWQKNKRKITLNPEEITTLKKSVVPPAPKASDQLEGLIACPGWVKGPAKIVKSATEIGKVKEGDIIVAVMTRPDYLPAIKKAAAIITDEGGITSHAAIIAREFNLPCVIATRHATKIFRDNEWLEIDTASGTIRSTGIIRRNQSTKRAKKSSS